MIEPYKEKLKNVLTKNQDLKIMQEVGNILLGERNLSNSIDFNPQRILSFKFAPIVSVDCEFFFSPYKDILTSKRLRLTPEHLRDQAI